MWNTTDMELVQWPPTAPMFVTNYFLYGAESVYLSSPKNSGNLYCNPTLNMLIIVHSAPSHFFERKTIRETYGNKGLLQQRKVGLLFFLGTVDDSLVQSYISQEIEKFNDIVQVNFADSYHNLTLKQLAIFNWYYTFCKLLEDTQNLATWIFKVDDDYFINVQLALQITKANPNADLVGLTLSPKPIRDISNSKWYVPKYMYASNYFDTYLLGCGYIAHNKLIPKFLQASLTVPIISLEDVYVTGLLAHQIGLLQMNLCEIPCPIFQEFTQERENASELWKKFKNNFLNCSSKLAVNKPRLD